MAASGTEQKLLNEIQAIAVIYSLPAVVNAGSRTAPLDIQPIFPKHRDANERINDTREIENNGDVIEIVETALVNSARCNCGQGACTGGCGVDRDPKEANKAFAMAAQGFGPEVQRVIKEFLLEKFKKSIGDNRGEVAELSQRIDRFVDTGLNTSELLRVFVDKDILSRWQDMYTEAQAAAVQAAIDKNPHDTTAIAETLRLETQSKIQHMQELFDLRKEAVDLLQLIPEQDRALFTEDMKNLKNRLIEKVKSLTINGMPVYGRDGQEVVEHQQLVDGYHRAFTTMTEASPFLLTGKLCPDTAPCMDSLGCTLGQATNVLNSVQIRTIEQAIEKMGWLMGWFDEVFVAPTEAKVQENGDKSVAVIGSGPAGLQAAFELRRQGFEVTVYEKEDKPGGLTTYGIPEHKIAKDRLDPYIEKMKAMGIKFEFNKEVGRDVTEKDLMENHDSIVHASGTSNTPRKTGAPVFQVTDEALLQAIAEGGAVDLSQFRSKAKQLDVEAESLGNVRFAMEVLGRDGVNLGEKNGRVVVIGAGDTEADVVGTFVRQRNQVINGGDEVASNVTVLDRNAEKKAPTNQHIKKDRGNDIRKSYEVTEMQESLGDNMQYSTSVDGMVVDGSNKLLGLVVTERELVSDSLRDINKYDLNAVEKAEYDKLTRVVKRYFLKADEVVVAAGYEKGKNPVMVNMGVIEEGMSSSRYKEAIGPKNKTTPKPLHFVAGDADPHNGSDLWVYALNSGKQAARAIVKMFQLLGKDDNAKDMSREQRWADNDANQTRWETLRSKLKPEIGREAGGLPSFS